MALDLGDVAVGFKADTSDLTKVGRQLKKSQAQASKFSSALDNAAKAAQLTEGPLSGIASRLTTLKGLLNTNTAALAAFSVALGATVSGAVTAARTYLQAEESLIKLGTAFVRTGRSSDAAFEQINQSAVSLARRTLLSLNEAREGLATGLTFSNLPTSELQRFADVAADAAAVTGRDFRNTIIQFGKALQNPASSLDGLNRLGISFTKSQRNVLATLVKTGQGAKATDIILSKLEATFKGLGDARGSSGQLDSLLVDLQLFRESIFLNSQAGDSLANLFSTLGTTISSLSGELSFAARFGNVLSKVFDSVSASLQFLQRNSEAIVNTLQILGGGLLLKVAAGWVALAKGINLSSKALVGFAAAAKKFLPLALFTGLVTLVDKFVMVGSEVSALRKTFEVFRAVGVVTVRRLSDIWSGFTEFFSTSIQKNSDSLKALQDNLKTVGMGFLDFASAAVDPLKIIPIAFIELSASVQDSFTRLFRFLSRKTEDLGNVFSAIANKDFKAARDAAANFFTTPSKNGLDPALENTDNLITRIIKNFNASEKIDLSKTFSISKNLFNDLLTAVEVSTLGSETKKAIRSFVDEVQDELSQRVSQISTDITGSNPLAGLNDLNLPDFTNTGLDLGSDLITGINNAIDQLGNSVSKKLADKLVGRDSTSFKEIAKDFVSGLFRSLIQEVLTNPLATDFKKFFRAAIDPDPKKGITSFANKGAQDGLLKSVGGLLGFANGGTPPVNRASIVGERGPELFVPRQVGTVVPNQAMQQMSGPTMVTLNINGVTDAQSFEVARSRITSEINRSIRNS